MADFLSEFNIKHVLVIPKHSLNNDQVKRVNQTSASVFARYLNSRHTDWDEKLTDTMFSINRPGQSEYEATISISTR